MIERCLDDRLGSLLAKAFDQSIKGAVALPSLADQQQLASRFAHRLDALHDLVRERGGRQVLGDEADDVGRTAPQRSRGSRGEELQLLRSSFDLAARLGADPWVAGQEAGHRLDGDSGPFGHVANCRQVKPLRLKTGMQKTVARIVIRRTMRKCPSKDI